MVNRWYAAVTVQGYGDRSDICVAPARVLRPYLDSARRNKSIELVFSPVGPILSELWVLVCMAKIPQICPFLRHNMVAMY